MKILLKPAARRDLRAIRVSGIETWGLARANDFLGQLIVAMERLAEHPYMGRSRHSLYPGLRSIRFRGYAIFYIVTDGSADIVAIFHERRNHAALSFANRMDSET